MKNFKKLLVSALFASTLVGCSSQTSQAKYQIGVVQIVQHPALDAATKGFEDALKAEFKEDVQINVQVASGDSATCITIANQFVSDGVQLIMANATPALQAAVSATNQIPILGTSVTEYGVALNLKDFNGTVGTNVSGTSDLAPLDQQAAMFKEILPNIKNIGILYSSSEPNSIYQANTVKQALEKDGYHVEIFTFADSNEVANVTQQAITQVEALYIPTDNTAASSAQIINNIAEPAGIPIIAGEKEAMLGFGIASLSIDYYELGKVTGQMAIDILKNGKDIQTMPIQYYPTPKKIYDAKRAAKLNIQMPSDYEAVSE